MSSDGPGISPSHSRVSLAMLMHNREANLLGNVHGGDVVRSTAQVNRAQINRAGKSLMEIGVRLEAEPWNAAGELTHMASGYFVFVAIDEDGNPRQVPSLLPETPDEVRRMREAEIRRAHRLARKTEIDRGRVAEE